MRRGERPRDGRRLRGRQAQIARLEAQDLAKRTPVMLFSDNGGTIKRSDGTGPL